MSHLVTGEAVVLELRAARLGSRALSLLIDIVVQLVALVAGGFLVAGVAAVADPALTAGVGLVVVVGIFVGYPVTFETLTRGRTLGKMALGLRTVREDGGPIRFRHALIRGLTGFVEIWLLAGTVAVFASLVSEHGRRVGDYLAGTFVVRDAAATPGGPVATMPPGMGPWAAGLELSGLPDDLALAARQYLARYRELAPEHRRDMGARLADAVAARVSPAPPADVAAPVYLSAVLAERSNRELRRMAPRPGPAPHLPSRGGGGHGGSYASPPPPPPPGGRPSARGHDAPQRGDAGDAPERNPFAPPG